MLITSSIVSFFQFYHESYLMHCIVERIEHLHSHLEEMERTGLCSYSKNIEKFFLYLIVTRYQKKERVYESDQCSIFEVRYIASALVILGVDGVVFLECLASGVISALMRGGKI